jgi:predicted transcriptional regulator of viral defense system
MNFLKLRDSLKDFTVFSLQDILQVDQSFHRRRLNEWQDKGYIRKVIKGFYIFSDLVLNENVLFEVSNRIYRPSYVSLESALSYYHLIPETVYGVTSVSTRRTYKFMTSTTEFSYRTVRPDFYFGYIVQAYNQKVFKIAQPEKAVLDYFYLNPHLKNENDFESLRVSSEQFFEIVDEEILFDYFTKSLQKSLKERISHFIDFMSAKK